MEPETWKVVLTLMDPKSNTLMLILSCVKLAMNTWRSVCTRLHSAVSHPSSCVRLSTHLQSIYTLIHHLPLLHPPTHPADPIHLFICSLPSISTHHHHPATRNDLAHCQLRRLNLKFPLLVFQLQLHFYDKKTQ